MVVLVPMAVPQADACLAAEAARHQCCAPPTHTPTPASASCCEGDVTPISDASGADHGECDCIHAPTAPEAVTVGTPTLAGDESSGLSDCLAPVAAFSPSPGTHGTVRMPGVASESPPLYLVGCAFLI
jgi:hypothetical protein